MREIKLIHKGVNKFKKRLGFCPNCLNYVVFLPATLDGQKKLLCRCGFYFPMKRASEIIVNKLNTRQKIKRVFRQLKEFIRGKTRKTRRGTLR